MNELVTIESVNPLTLFTDKAMDPLLEDITRQAEDFEADVSTPGGRAKIKSMAHKVARSKTFLDGLGKDLNDDARQRINATDKSRRKMRGYLDALRDKVRKPVTDWEEDEKDRIAKHADKLLEISEAGRQSLQDWDTLPMDAMRERLDEIETTLMGDEAWEEFAGDAAEAKDAAIIAIKDAIAKREEQDAQDAEVERLRKEAEERERADREAEEARQRQAREDEIRREAEAAQKRADEEAAAKVAEEAEARRQDAIREKEDAEERAAQAERDQKEAAEQAERDRISAAEQAKKDEEFARLQERDRIAAEERAAQEAAAKREADTKHRKTINNAAKDALVFAGISKDDAESVIREIALGNVPNVRISY